MKKFLTSVAVVGALVVGSLGLTSGPASAATVRTGARWYQVDVLLTHDETLSAARGVAGGAAVCWGLGGAGGAAGGLAAGPAGAFAGAVLSGGGCMTAVTLCAAEAALKGRSAGMTVSGLRMWCWDY